MKIKVIKLGHLIKPQSEELCGYQTPAAEKEHILMFQVCRKQQEIHPVSQGTPPECGEHGGEPLTDHQAEGRVPARLR